MQKLIDHYNKNRRRYINRYARLTGSTENGEDVVQEAYTRAVKYYDSFNVGGNFDFWFSRILKNTFHRFLNTERGHPSEEFDEELVEGCQEKGYTVVLLEQLLQEINKFEEPLQEVLILYFRNGYSPSDISKVVDMRRRSVEQFIYRFKSNLRDIHNEDICR